MLRRFSRSLRSLNYLSQSCGCPVEARRCLTSNFVRRQYSATSDSHLPRLAQTSLWETIFPKSIRQKTRELIRPPQKRPANPASYFIWIYLLIGSQAIRILAVKNESEVYMRRADLQIAKLREVIDKLQRGESVDVEKTLGTGDETEEQEWENALREIEREERAWQQSRREKDEQTKQFEEQQSKFDLLRQDASPVNQETQPQTEAENAPESQKPPSAPGFF